VAFNLHSATARETPSIAFLPAVNGATNQLLTYDVSRLRTGAGARYEPVRRGTEFTERRDMTQTLWLGS